ncbi:MAG: FISUMP domain-containing protein [Candidatus Marinimicrobia bacterium]|nr:FISUMP domain-containing protein [Candidatus Neomarinimicrobiota bacterium]
MIIDLEAGSGISTGEANAFTDAISSWVINSSYYDLVDREHTAEIIEEQKFQLTGLVNSTQLVELGNLMGLQYMITGNVRSDGENRTVSLKLLSIEKGSYTKSASETERIRVYYYKPNGEQHPYRHFLENNADKVMDSLLKIYSAEEVKPWAPTPLSHPFNKETGTLTDSRDGKVYKTTTIGEQTWMAENLNFKMEEGIRGTRYYAPKWNGRYYTWEAAQKACPDGWHVPSKEEFQELFNFISDEYGPMPTSDIAWYLKSQERWEKGKTGTDVFGFNAIPSGYQKDGDWNHLDEAAYYWTANSEGENDYVYSTMYYSYSSNRFSYGSTMVDPYSIGKMAKKFFVNFWELAQGHRWSRVRRHEHIYYCSVRCVKD